MSHILGDPTEYGIDFPSVFPKNKLEIRVVRKFSSINIHMEGTEPIHFKDIQELNIEAFDDTLQNIKRVFNYFDKIFWC